MTVEQNQIVIRRAGEENGDGGADDSDSDDDPELDPDRYDA